MIKKRLKPILIPLALVVFTLLFLYSKTFYDFIIENANSSQITDYGALSNEAKLQKEIKELHRSLDKAIQDRASLEDEISLLSKKLENSLNRSESANAAVDIPDSSTHNEAHNDNHGMVLITLVSSDDMKSLRELVGSLHYRRKDNLDVHLILVYEFGLSEKEKQEIQLWRNVELVLSKTLLMGHDVVVPEGDHSGTDALDWVKLRRLPMVLLNVLDINMRKYKNVIYVDVGSTFKGDSLHKLGEVLDSKGSFFLSPSSLASEQSLKYHQYPVIGLRQGTKDSLVFLGLELQCLRKYHCDSALRRELTEEQDRLLKLKSLKSLDFQVEAPSNGNNYFCYLLLRDDILYSTEFTSVALSHSHEKELDSTATDKLVMSIGMPTLSLKSMSSFKDTAPCNTFVPSFLDTIDDDEWGKFAFRLYIGFDTGDIYFDNPSTLTQIHEYLTSLVEEKKQKLSSDIASKVQVDFEYVKFPFSKGWVTYIWNGLFVRAINEGADYYYQVNDDLKLDTSRWATYFKESLDTVNGVGVTGPFDERHGGRLLTQACVSRKHYEIFGRFYPLDIKVSFVDVLKLLGLVFR